MNKSAYTVTDICKAAVNVADSLDVDQSDYGMHVVNLALGYGFRIKKIPGQNKKQTRWVR